MLSDGMDDVRYSSTQVFAKQNLLDEDQDQLLRIKNCINRAQLLRESELEGQRKM